MQAFLSYYTYFYFKADLGQHTNWKQCLFLNTNKANLFCESISSSDSLVNCSEDLSCMLERAVEMASNLSCSFIIASCSSNIMSRALYNRNIIYYQSSIYINI